VRPGARLMPLDVVAGLLSLAVGIYLLYTLFRAEDF
jgi:K+-transporting ATPase KdpF subunit